MIKTPFRLPSGEIDRREQIEFEFNGKAYFGYEGDTLASALLANGIFLTARSFKYHRPRGIMGAGVEEPSCLVELLGEMRLAIIQLRPYDCAQAFRKIS